jgi:hypothetical protein
MESSSLSATIMALINSISAEDIRLLFRNYTMRANTRRNALIGKEPWPQSTSTSRYSYRVKCSSDYAFDSESEEEPLEWIGKAMAKAQSYQEQKVFAKRQCVRFGLDGEESNEYGVEDEDDEKDDEDEVEDAEQVTEAKREFSRLAKMVSAMEQHTFVAMGSVRGPKDRKRYRYYK